jgi:hypothetical protein
MADMLSEIELIQTDRIWLPAAKWIAAWLVVLGLLDVERSAHWLALHGVKRIIRTKS